MGSFSKTWTTSPTMPAFFFHKLDAARRFAKYACWATLASALYSGMPLHGAVLYWDDNGTTAGTSVTPNGIWGSSAFWSTSAAGTAATANTTAGLKDEVTFSAGETATGSYTVTVSGDRGARFINFEEGSILFQDGRINLLHTGSGINFNSTSGIEVTIESDLAIGGSIVFDTKTIAGNRLNLQAGTLTRINGATLNLRGSGQIYGGMNGFNANDTSGILGPWLTFGTGTGTRFATLGTGDQILAYTGGTAAANAAGLSGSASGNYDLAAGGGTAPTTINAHTIRYTGGSGTVTLGSGGMTVNGIMNAGSGTLTITGNTLTIGDNRELVIHNASSSMAIASDIQDSVTGSSSLVKTGTSSLTLRGNNSYTGHTYINQGTLIVAHNNALGTADGHTYLNTFGSSTNSGTLSLTNGVTIAEQIIIDGLGDGVDSNWGGSITTTEVSGGSSAVGGNNYNTITGKITLASNYSYRFGAAANTVLNLATIERMPGHASTVVFSASGSGIVNVTESMLVNNAPITVHGGGNARLSASNNAIGDVTVANNSKLYLAADNALTPTKSLIIGGNSTNTTTGTNNDVGYLYIEGTTQTINGLHGHPNKGSGAVIGTSEKRLISGQSANDSELIVGYSNGGATFDGVIQDGSLGGKLSFVKIGTGTQVLTGTVANTYTGSTTVNGGTLDLFKTAGINAISGDIKIGDSTGAQDVLRLLESDQIANSSTITLEGTGTTAGIFRLNNFSETIAGLNSTSGGIVENGASAAGNSVLTLSAGAGQVHSYSGILQHGSTSTAILSVNKTGGGSQTFSGASTYTGGTEISGGTLYANNSSGSATGFGNLIVTSAGRLGGTGRIELNASSRAQISGTLSPGAGDGLMESLEISIANATGATSSGITLNAATLAFDLGAGGSSINSVGISDQLLLSGTMNETSDFTIAAASTINLATIGGEGWYKLIDTSATSDLTWSGLSINTTTREIESGLTLSGLPSNLHGSLYLGSGSLGDYGDVYLYIIPEPKMAMLFAMGMSTLLFSRRRRGA